MEDRVREKQSEPERQQCQHCFDPTCTMQVFRTACCQNEYCPSGLQTFFSDNAAVGDLRCEECNLVLDLQMVDTFFKTLPAIELKMELKNLLSDRTKPRLLCPRGRSIDVERTHKVLTCDACRQEGTPNPFFCANCRSPVARSLSVCASNTCLKPREVLHASL